METFVIVFNNEQKRSSIEADTVQFSVESITFLDGENNVIRELPAKSVLSVWAKSAEPKAKSALA